MIDIHPPQHAPMTLREFFTHLGIVVLGILIAIGLEQTVEYLHHRHQVAELREQMRVEAQNNLPLIRESITRLETQNAISIHWRMLCSPEISRETTSTFAASRPREARPFTSRRLGPRGQTPD